jgi:hypothetical protein
MAGLSWMDSGSMLEDPRANAWLDGIDKFSNDGQFGRRFSFSLVNGLLCPSKGAPSGPYHYLLFAIFLVKIFRFPLPFPTHHKYI